MSRYFMNAPLPSAEQLEKLPMRAVVAYAARTTRRLSSELRGIVADDILDDALRLVDAVSTKYLLGEMDEAAIIYAAHDVAAAYAAAPAELQSLEKFRIVFSFGNAAMASMRAIDGAADLANARHHMTYAASYAQRAVGALHVLADGAAEAAADAARRDYEVLLKEYGEHDEVVIGDPIDCFDDE